MRFAIVHYDLWLDTGVRKFILVRTKQSYGGIIVKIQNIVPGNTVNASVSEILISLLTQ